MVILSALKEIFFIAASFAPPTDERKRHGKNAITASSKIFVEWLKRIFRKDAAVKNLYVKSKHAGSVVFVFLEPFTFVLNKQLQSRTGCTARSFTINDKKNAYRRDSFRRNESRNC